MTEATDTARRSADEPAPDRATEPSAPPTLSVTVLNYNYGRYLAACIESILAQTFRDFELIVIDDCSSDDSLEVVQPYLADPRVRLIAHQKNVGYKGSLIEGTEEHSRGAFLSVISADDLVRRQDAFERQVAMLRAHPSTTFCFAAYGRFDDATGQMLEQHHSYDGDQVVPGERFFRDYLTRQDVQVVHSGTMIRRAAYEHSGGYRRDLNISLDFALWLVLSLEGDVAYCDEVLYGYRAHENQMSQSFQKVTANTKECLHSVEVAVDRARLRGLPIASIREEAIKYILFAIALDDAFSDRPKLALARSLSALAMQPWLALTSRGLWVVLIRLLLGRRGTEALRALLGKGGEPSPPVHPTMGPLHPHGPLSREQERGSAAGTASAGPGIVPRPPRAPAVRGLRVVLLVNSIAMGGAEEHVRQVATGLRRRGADVTVIMPETSDVDPLATALEATGVRVERLTLAWGLHGWHTLGRFGKLVSLLKRLRPRLLHLHTIGYTGGRWAVWAARAAGVPTVVCTIHIAPTAPQPLHVRLDRAVQSALVDRFVAVSQGNGTALRDDLGLPASKLVVIPNAVELQNFSGDGASARRAARERFGIPQDAPVVGALARLDTQKGLTYLIQALPAILASHPTVHVLLVGDGPLRADLDREAESLGVGDRVHFAGYQRDVIGLLRAMDLAALPSIREGLPLSLLEAMAAGLPVVATRVGGMPEVVVDGVTGRLVPPADPDTLAQAINQVLGEPRCAERMGEAARARASDFSDDALLDRISAVYRAAHSR